MQLHRWTTWPREDPAAVWRNRYIALKALWIEHKTKTEESSISLEKAAFALQAMEASFLRAQEELQDKLKLKEYSQDRAYVEETAKDMLSDDGGALKNVDCTSQRESPATRIEIQSLKAELVAMAEQHESYSATQLQLVESLVREADGLKSQLRIEEANYDGYVRSAEEKESQWKTKVELLYKELMDAKERRHSSMQLEDRLGEANERLKSSTSNVVKDPTWEVDKRRLVQTQQTLEADAERMETEMKALYDARAQSNIDAAALRDELSAALAASDRYRKDARALEDKEQQLSEARTQTEHSARALMEELTEATFAHEQGKAEARAHKHRADRLSQEKATLLEEIQALDKKAQQEEETRALQHASFVEATEQASLWISQRNELQSTNTLLREDLARTELKCEIASKMDGENAEIITALRANLIKLGAESKSLEEEKLLQDEEKKTLEREIKRLVSVNTEQTDIISTLRRDLNEAKTVSKLLEIGKEVLEQNAERSAGMMRQLQETKNEDIFRLREALSEAATARSQLEEKINTSESDLKALTRMHKTELQEQKRQIKSEHDEIVYELTLERDHAEREKHDRQIVNDELADLVEKMKIKMVKTEAELHSVRTTLNTQTHSIEAKKVEMQQSDQSNLCVVKKLREENMELTRRLAAEEAVHENSKKIKDNLDATSQALRRKLTEHESQAAMARSKLEEKIKTSESDLEGLTRMHKTELQELKRQIKSEHDEIVYELTVERDHAEREKHDRQIVNDELADLVERMKIKMVKTEAELQSVRTTLNTQTQSIEAKKVEMQQSDQSNLCVVKKLREENMELTRRLAAEEAVHENSKKIKDHLDATSQALRCKLTELESQAEVEAVQQIDLAEGFRQLCGQCTSMNIKISSLVTTAAAYPR